MMYSLMDAEYFWSCAFFIVCLLVLNFWLLNILVAVITNTFADIMDETKCSAFASASGSVTVHVYSTGTNSNIMGLISMDHSSVPCHQMPMM